MAYISDSTNFSTVNASANTLLATAQDAIDFYNPTIIVNTWYRYYDILNTTVYEDNESLIINSQVGSPNNGIIQKLSGLIVGQTYNIKINIPVNNGTTTVLIYTGTELQSSNPIEGYFVGDFRTITFVANSTEDTIVIDAIYLSTGAVISISSIEITENTRLSIPSIEGMPVKPLSISELSEVTFTDGANVVTPNQIQCEAFGYTYNKVTGTCTIARFNTNLNRGFDNVNNKSSGAGNTTQTGTNNTYIMGENNTVRGMSRNSIITGSNNAINNGVNNASVSGTLGEVTAANSIVLGGNAGSDTLGERQLIELIYGTQSTGNPEVDSYLNNTVDSYFVIPDNTAMYFHADIIALRTGGVNVSGAVGDYGSWVERGVVINKSGVLSINRERDTIKDSGDTTGWRPLAAVSGTNFVMGVKGNTDMTIEWASTIRFTQIKAGVTL